MNIFTHIAQASAEISTYSDSGMSVLSDSSSSGDLAAMAGAAVFFVFFAFFIAIMYVISSVLLMQIFKKAGVPGWAAWVPVFNNWKMLEIGGQKGFWAILSLIPIINIVSGVIFYIAQYHIGLKLGKSGGFVVLAIFLPIVWFIWLAVDKSVWNEDLSEAKSLHVPDHTAVSQPAAPADNVQL